MCEEPINRVNEVFREIATQLLVKLTKITSFNEIFPIKGQKSPKSNEIVVIQSKLERKRANSDTKMSEIQLGKTTHNVLPFPPRKKLVTLNIKLHFRIDSRHHNHKIPHISYILFIYTFTSNILMKIFSFRLLNVAQTQT